MARLTIGPTINLAPIPSKPSSQQSLDPQVIERIVEVIKEVPVEKLVEVRVEVPVERVVEKVLTVEVPVEKIVEKIVTVEVPVEKLVEVEVESKETKAKLKELDRSLHVLSSSMIDIRQDLLVLKNKPTKTDRLEQELAKFKRNMIIYSVIQTVAGIAYLLVKGL